MLSIRLATLTVFPQMSYWGLRAPITPATTGPTLMPGRQSQSGLWAAGKVWRGSLCADAVPGEKARTLQSQGEGSHRARSLSKGASSLTQVAAIRINQPKPAQVSPGGPAGSPLSISDHTCSSTGLDAGETRRGKINAKKALLIKASTV